jgi:hypothetical protein
VIFEGSLAGFCICRNGDDLSAILFVSDEDGMLNRGMPLNSRARPSNSVRSAGAGLGISKRLKHSLAYCASLFVEDKRDGSCRFGTTRLISRRLSYSVV